ncbi:MAG: type I methionyl aminopeptidase, partial [Candidatus Omnitrophica bacterium]|nr:type I methionyl aminopeptidase [Candidatus Omnitrophota bacterium]
MIPLKTKSEIEKIRKAGAIVTKTLKFLKSIIVPGITTLELDEKAAKFIKKHNGNAAFYGYHGYPAHICVSINEEVVHGIPSGRVILEGDIASIDVGIEYNGYFGDAALTFPVGKVTKEAAQLIEVTREALYKGIALARPGNHLYDISHAVQEHAENTGFSVVRDFVGHGIGAKLHEEPQVPNFGNPGSGVNLEPGMVLAIEPMVN